MLKRLHSDPPQMKTPMTFHLRDPSLSAFYMGNGGPTQPTVEHEVTLHSAQMQVRVKVLTAEEFSYTGEIEAFTPELVTNHQGYKVGDLVQFLGSHAISFSARTLNRVSS
jgi:hypothetical protein